MNIYKCISYVSALGFVKVGSIRGEVEGKMRRRSIDPALPLLIHLFLFCFLISAVVAL